VIHALAELTLVLVRRILGGVNREDFSLRLHVAAFVQREERDRLALEEDETYTEAWYGLGCCYDALERFVEALEYFNRAVKHCPNSADLWYAKADCEYRGQFRYLSIPNSRLIFES